MQLDDTYHTMRFTALLAFAGCTLTARAAPHSHDYYKVRLPIIPNRRVVVVVLLSCHRSNGP